MGGLPPRRSEPSRGGYSIQILRTPTREWPFLTIDHAQATIHGAEGIEIPIGRQPK